MIAEAMRRASVTRYQKYLDTGEYPDGMFSKIWDMLDWIDAQKN